MLFDNECWDWVYKKFRKPTQPVLITISKSVFTPLSVLKTFCCINAKDLA